jgi:hypothetical protein
MQFVQSEIQSLQEIHRLFETGFELEIRIGSFQSTEKNKANRRFIPGVEVGQFNSAIKYFSAYGWPKQEYRTVEEGGFDPPYDDVRRSEDGTLLRKRKIKMLDVPAYGIRVALSNEQPMDPNVLLTGQKSIRTKTRTSLFSQNVRYDFTNVLNDNGKRVYEIELEWISGDFNILMQHCETMLQVLNKSSILTPNHIIQSVLQDYQSLVGAKHSKHFIGAMPKTLSRKNVTTIHGHAYAVSQKFDGQRGIIFVDKGGRVWKIYRNMHVVNTGMISKSVRSTILDGEITNHQGHEIFWGFDLIAFETRDVRGNVNWNYQNRWEKLNVLIEQLNSDIEIMPNLEYVLKINVKSIVWSVSQWMELPPLPPNVLADGYIFTPIMEPYSMSQFWNSQFKWKTQQTIDVAIENVEGNWKLFVNDGNNIIPFEQCPIIEVDKSMSNLESGTIVECEWNSETLIPIRVRMEKTSPNNINVAMDVIEAITNPVTESMIFGQSGYGYNQALIQIEKNIGMSFVNVNWGEEFSDAQRIGKKLAEIVGDMEEDDIIAVTFPDGAALANSVILADGMFQIIEDWGDMDNGLLAGIQISPLNGGWSSLRELHTHPFGLQYEMTVFDLKAQKAPGPDFVFSSSKIVTTTNLVFTDVFISAALDQNIQIIGLQFMSDALPEETLSLLGEFEKVRLSMQRVAILQYRPTKKSIYESIGDNWYKVPRDMLHVVTSCVNTAHAILEMEKPLKLEFKIPVPNHWGMLMVTLDEDKALARKEGNDWIVVHPRSLIIAEETNVTNVSNVTNVANVANVVENLRNLNVEKLREYAASKNLVIPSKIRRKEEIRQYLEEHR